MRLLASILSQTSLLRELGPPVQSRELTGKGGHRDSPTSSQKCVDAAFSTLRQRGVRILDYLDDWFVLAQSEDKLNTHRVPAPQSFGMHRV